MEDAKDIDAREVKQKRIHPFENSNFIKKIFFCWLFPLFRQGLKSNLTEDDIYPPLKSHESQMLGVKIQNAWQYELKYKKSPSLWRALFKVFGKELTILAIFASFIELGVKLSQPLFLSKLLSYYEPVPKITLNEAYFYSASIICASFLTSVCNHNYMLRVFHLGMKIRVATSALIYRKALRLSKSSLAETTVGQMVNLLANDVSRFETAMNHLHNVWLAPVTTTIVIGLLYVYVGYTGVIGGVFLAMFVPIQMFMAQKTSEFRLGTAIRTDERIRLMNEIISGMQVIKMYTWEKPFAKLVELTRIKEIAVLQKMSVIRALTMSFNMTLSRIAVYICILTYVLTGNVPTAQYTFVVMAFYAVLRLTVTQFFPQGITQLAETRISIKRVRKFLMYEELEYLNDRSNSLCVSQLKLNNGLEKHLEIGNSLYLKRQVSSIYSPGVFLSNLSAKWLKSAQDNCLENINFGVEPGQLAVVVGPVGAGKTTLLHVILQELPPSTGTVSITGNVSYASQEPWLFGGSVRQNILFGQEYNAEKYKEVVRVCALERDFTLFPYGDRTLTGDRGVSLSGGQKARINLARAIYKEADIYLLDDPLSAVDTHVGRQLFDECITGYLKKKCVVLVTHQLQYLKNAQKICLLEDGRILESGNYTHMINSGRDYAKMFLTEKEDKNDNENISNDAGTNKSADNNLKDDKTAGPTQTKETKGMGQIGWSVYKIYLLSGGHWCKILSLFIVFVMAQTVGSLCEYFLTFWVNTEQLREQNRLQNSLPYYGNGTVTNKTILALQRVNRNEEISSKSLSVLDSLLVSENIFIAFYSTLLGLLVTLTLTRSLVFYRFCMKASVRLHNNMFDKIVFAPMRFFNTNPVGRILNRFSKDMGGIDEIVPVSLLDTLQIGLMVIAISFVIGSVSPWMFLCSIVMLTIFYGLRILFLATSRDIKRLEAITRSPIFSHLTASLQGLTTIRAFGAQEILKREFDNYQDQYSSAFFMFLAANRTFGFWLDMHCVVYITLVTLSFLLFQDETLGGNVGLAITQATTLTGMFQWGMRQWSELENQMTCVERVKEYADITPETTKDAIQPPKNWPEHGKIKFDNMCLKYATEDPYVLKNLTFTIQGTEKIGIVGRTGAGKSSLIAALFRLTDIEGRILIDTVDTKHIALEILRSKISIIPQEPVLFSGSLRKNLDPFDEYSDDCLWQALEEVELKEAISDLPHGLDSRISEGGSNFSVGQRQLICLARAIVRSNKVLVLDEATANVDPQTDILIQKTIREKFAHCTVLTIAHRLHTIMDSDKVLVMDAGRVAEFGHPYDLLQNPDGVFSELVAQTGKTMAENLYGIAKVTFEKTTKLALRDA